jgi:hypothetical protein
MGARKYEQRSLIVKQRINSLPGVAEQAFPSKEVTELFRPRIARDLVSQLSQSSAVAPCKHHSPSVIGMRAKIGIRT